MVLQTNNYTWTPNEGFQPIRIGVLCGCWFFPPMFWVDGNRWTAVR